MKRFKMNADSRNRNTRRRIGYYLIAALFAVSALLGPGQTQPAEAASGYAYYWKLEFDFNTNMNGRLTVEAGKGTVGNLTTVLATGVYEVPCRRQGDVAIGGGVATFKGGHLQCELDLGQAITRTFVQCALVDSACTYTVQPNEVYESVRMWAKVRSSQVGMTPIFHHPDASFYANVLSGSTLQLHNDLNPVGSISSPVISLPGLLGSWQNYAARYICAVGPACNMTYSAGGSTWPVGPYFSTVQMQTAPVDIYVGYDPVGATPMPSPTQLDHLFIDPPAIGEN